MYKDQAEFFVVYIREAHPEDGWQVASNTRAKIIYNQPKTIAERKKTAMACQVGLKIKIPIIVDGMDNAVNKAYNAWPDRLYIIGKDGKVFYRGGPGPRGFKAKDMEKALIELLKKK